MGGGCGGGGRKVCRKRALDFCGGWGTRNSLTNCHISPGLPKLVFFSQGLYTLLTCVHPLFLQAAGSVQRANAASWRRAQ